jgi:class 3 adenylate cyclase/tetratricopeptide (TPR) repeat protein
MELFAERDPEAAQKLLDPVLERMIEAVHWYEGTVNRVMGDGIMALFGAPIAHEDHAVRACYAALRMQETIKRYAADVQRTCGAAVTIRVGLNSGEIVVCGVGKDLHIDYTVVGQTANLAARLEQMAPGGAVLTTADTFQLVEGYIAVTPLGPMPVKGLASPIQVYEVESAGAARTRLQVSAERGLTRFVGRRIELEQLRQFQQLASEGRGQVVTIVGEAGVGKSRLVREFVHSECTADCLILESNAASYSHATSYLPVIELLKDYFKVNAHDSTQSIREKVTARILALDPSLNEDIPPLLDLLDALDDEHPFRSLDPFHHRQRTYQAIIRLLLGESRVHLVLALFENVRADDSLTIGLLNELAVRIQNARILLIFAHRPDYRDDWRNQPNYHQLRLDPLISDGLAELLEALLGTDPGLTGLKSFLADRTAGNPFFAEEIVRALVETGVIVGTRCNYRAARPFSSIEVPPTVQAVLAARIDALPVTEKHLLQEAAIIGHDVPFALLHTVCGLAEDRLRGMLDNLQTADFLYVTELFPDLQYAFRHSLTHDVAYRGMLHERRRDLHARALDAIEVLYADRLSEHVERLARHAVRGALQAKAIHYLRQAGAKAATRSALFDARACFEQALDVLKSLPESQATLEQAFEIRLDLRAVLRQLGEVRQMLERLREAEALAERLSDDPRRGRALALMTTVLSTLDELDEALATGTRAVEIATRAEDWRLRIVTTSCLQQAYYYRGDYERVVEIATENLAALPTEWDHEYFGLAVPPSVFTRGWLMRSLIELGRFSEAARYEAETIRLAESTEHAHTIVWAHLTASMLHVFKGEWTKAQLLTEQSINVRRSLDVAVLLPWAVASSAWALAQIGEASEAWSRVQEARQLLEGQTTIGVVGHRTWSYYAVSRACLLLGRIDEARQLGSLSFESSQHQPGFRAHSLHLLGDLAAHPDQFDAEIGVAHYRQALALAKPRSMRPLVAHCHLGLSKLYQHTGQPKQALENLTAATNTYRELDMDFWLEEREASAAAGSA